MAFGELKRQLEALVHANPSGLTTAQIYRLANSTTAGEQANIRSELKRMASHRVGKVLRTAVRTGSGPSTFMYFPPSDAGRQAMSMYTPGQLISKTLPYQAPVTNTTQTTTLKRRGRKPKSGSTRIQVLEFLANRPNGAFVSDVLKATKTSGYGRKVLYDLAAENKLYRFRAGKASSSERGGAPWVFFPRTPEGREGLRQFKERMGSDAPTRTYERRVGQTPLPSKAAFTPTTREFVPGGTTTTQPFTAQVEALIRLTLPDGVHDIPMSAARQLKDQLTTVFG